MKKIALLALSAFGLASASTPIWGTDKDQFPNLQVQTPSIVTCWSSGGDDSDPDDPCYKAGGWWFGYDYGGGSIKVFLDGAWTPFIKGVGLTDMETGTVKIADALQVELTAASSDGKEWAGSGFGFNYFPDASPRKTENISGKSAYCLKYKSDGDLLARLGHDEEPNGGPYSADCTYEIDLPNTNEEVLAKTLYFTDFDLPEWCSGKDAPANLVPAFPFSVENASSFKIANPATQATTGTTVAISVYELGYGDCDPSPILGSVAKSNVNFSMVGRVVSMSVKEPTTVQVISLQGAVVHTQTLTSTSTMNLSKLPTGIYMLRAPALGYTSRILLK